MAELLKKLHFLKNGTEQTAKAYSTTAEAGAEYVTNKIDGVTCYVAIGDTTDNRATVGRVKKSSIAAERAILSTGKPPYNKIEYRTPGTYTVTIPPGTPRVKYELAGAGGGGGRGTGGGGGADVRGADGGSGELLNNTANVNVNGGTITIVVGAGGRGGDWRYGLDGVSGGNTTLNGLLAVTSRGGGGGGHSYQVSFYDDGSDPVFVIGKPGVSYGNGGYGGRGQEGNGNAGGNGWAIIEYGGDI